MRINVFKGSIITTPLYWYSATQAEPACSMRFFRKVGVILVTFSHDCTVTTYNTEVVITDEIDQNYSGIQVSP
jgi:hypothetical protein